MRQEMIKRAHADNDGAHARVRPTHLNALLRF